METNRDVRMIARVRAARDAYAAPHGRDVAALFKDIGAAQEAWGRLYTRDFGRLVRAAAPVTTQVTTVVRQVERSLRPVLERLNELAAAAAPLLAEFNRIAVAAAAATERIRPFLEELHEWNQIGEALNKIGWLPHHSVPYSIVAECEGDLAQLDSRVADYYHIRWNDIRDDMESRLEDHHIDDEARATFREALSAHEAGFYRCICRALFPEIERMIGAGRVGSRKMLDKLLGESEHPAGLAFREIYNPVLFDRLVRHAYEQVVTEDDRERFEQDPVPNRHAAVHGLVAYSTHKNSMNMLILTEYVFRIFRPVKESHTWLEIEPQLSA